jgi:hypothetical protein
MVRSAATGISAVVDARGLIVESTALFEEAVLVADVKPLALPSVYVRWGDWFAWGSILVSFPLLAWGLVRRRRRDRLVVVLPAAVLMITAPIGWQINPHVPVADYVFWGIAVCAVVFAAAARPRPIRQASRIDE